MSIFPIISLMAILFNVFLLSYVFEQRRRSPVNTAFFIVVGMVAAWNLIQSMLYFDFCIGYEMLVHRLIICLWIPLGFGFLNFAYRMDSKKNDWIFWSLAATTLACVIIAQSTDLVLVRNERGPHGSIDIRGPLHSLVGANTAVSAIYGLIIIFKKSLRMGSDADRATYRLIVAGGMLAIGAVVAVAIILPNFLGVQSVIPIGPATLTIFSAFLAWAMLRYNFLIASVDLAVEQMFVSLGDGIVLTDPDGKVRQINEAGCQFLEKNLSEVLGRPMVELLSEYDFVDDVRDEEIELVRGLTKRVLSLSLTTVIRKDMTIGRLVLLRDVTEQKHVEENLIRSSAILERQKKQYVEERERVHKLEAVGTLAGGIAHDFNNLLAAILGFTTAASEEAVEGSARAKDLDEIMQAARRARDIVQQILVFSRRHEYEVEENDLRDTVAEAIELIKISLPSTIRVHLNHTTEACIMMGDPEQIKQIVVNLCTNAYHAMRDTGGELTIRLDLTELDDAFVAGQPLVDKGRYIRISVSDTGTGMDRETADAVFDPFFTTKQTGEGTGLGLSTALGIAAGHGGTITVESRLGVGTTFYVYLPVLTTEA
jgi:signal transduction histidine kinase